MKILAEMWTPISQIIDTILENVAKSFQCIQLYFWGFILGTISIVWKTVFLNIVNCSNWIKIQWKYLLKFDQNLPRQTNQISGNNSNLSFPDFSKCNLNVSKNLYTWISEPLYFPQIKLAFFVIIMNYLYLCKL
jgi:hypothetical protein